MKTEDRSVPIGPEPLPADNTGGTGLAPRDVIWMSARVSARRLPAGDAHVPGDRGGGVAAVDDEVVNPRVLLVRSIVQSCVSPLLPLNRSPAPPVALPAL